VDGEEIARDGRSGISGSESARRWKQPKPPCPCITYANVPTAQASPTDRIWGIGFGAAEAEENRGEWGENRLGEAITKVRERLRRESE
jgi:hypothetical protein